MYAQNPPDNYRLADLTFDPAGFDAIRPMHALYDATDPDLSRFAEAGGKVILWHGWARSVTATTQMPMKRCWLVPARRRRPCPPGEQPRCSREIVASLSFAQSCGGCRSEVEHASFASPSQGHQEI